MIPNNGTHERTLDPDEAIDRLRMVRARLAEQEREPELGIRFDFLLRMTSFAAIAFLVYLAFHSF